MLTNPVITSEMPVRKHRIRKFLRRYNVSIVLAFGFILLGGLYTWTILPAPYNLQYKIKLATKRANFVCRDETYSWAVDRQGACSDHGGVKLYLIGR